jgi:hypothetical protein
VLQTRASTVASADNSGVSKSYISRWRGLKIGDQDLLDVAVVSLHLKAFPNYPASCSQREAQASLARTAVEDLAAEG